MALAALLFSGLRLRLPPIRLPLALFMAGTVISLLASSDPHAGLPQIRKFFVFLILLCIYSTFRNVNQVRGVVLAWAGIAALSAIRSIFQFLQKYQEAQALHQSFYNYYVGERITGFTSHWMTFGGEEMIVMLMLAALLLLGPRTRWSTAGWISGAILLVSVILGYTRSIFLLGVPIGFIYLLWFWRRWMVLAVPALAAVALFAVPGMKDRVQSVMTPHGERDSNMHRIILRRTGVEMIRAHPLLGIGPEGPKYQFEKYVPKDIPRPLPEGWYGHLHNIYLQYAAERGIPTALMLFWLIGKVLYDFILCLRRKAFADTRWVLHGAIACILAILAEGYYEYNLGDSEVLTLFLSVVAFGYIAVEQSNHAAERA